MTIKVPAPTTVLPIKYFVCPGCGKAFGARMGNRGNKSATNMIACIYCDFTQHQKDFKRVVY